MRLLVSAAIWMPLLLASCGGSDTGGPTPTSTTAAFIADHPESPAPEGFFSAPTPIWMSGQLSLIPSGEVGPPGVTLVLNGITIPLPSGAHFLPGPISEPNYTTFSCVRGESQVTFSPEGWIAYASVSAVDLDAFDPTLDALALAAAPVSVGGANFRVPRGAIYFPPLFSENPEGWSGPPEEAPSLHLLKRGNSTVSFDDDGNVVAARIAEEDADDFAPILEALGE